MKLVTLKTQNGGSAGVVIGREVLDFAKAAEILPAARLLAPNWIDILGTGDDGMDVVRRLIDRIDASDDLGDNLRARQALVAIDSVRLDAPVPRPGLILSCGTNYRAHMEEFNAALPARPGAFIKYSGSVIGSGEPIVLPRSNPDWVDYEGEFCFVFGKPCHEVPEAGALDYILGYTFTNDVSARDWVSDVAKANGPTESTQAVMSNTLGKSFPTFAPLGPSIVTKDEIADPHAIEFETRVNGNVMQRGNTADFIFSIPWLIAEYSKHFHFMPGDVVTTGSPPGVGLAQKPPLMLRPGFLVEISAPGFDTLSNLVVAA